MTDYSELKRLAEAATNARWHEDDLGDALEFAPLDGEDQAFILAASPSVVFDLIAENERLRAQVSVTMGIGSGDGNLFVHGDYDSIKAAQKIVIARDQLKADNEALRKDAERYRWMRSSFVRNRKHSLVWYLPMMTPLTAEGLDENIDAAMSKGEQP